MSDDNLTRQYHQDMLRNAQRLLRTVDQMINGEAGIVLSVADLGWLRAGILDAIERAEAALGLRHSQDPDSIRRTIRLGALSAEAGQPQGATLVQIWNDMDEQEGESTP